MSTCKATVILGEHDICKGCLKADVCKHKANLDKDPIIGMSVEQCEYFKDRSKSVDLPCKVGEDLYRLKTINSKTIITTTQLNQNTLWRIVFGGEYGKSVFLTKEEAEKALEERSEK